MELNSDSVLKPLKLSGKSLDHVEDCIIVCAGVNNLMGYRVERWNGSEPPDAEELMKKMSDEGYSVFQWTDAAGAVYTDHEHGDDQSHWIISGTLELKVRGHGIVVLNAGDRDFMPAGMAHSARVIGGGAVVYLIGAK